MSLAILALAVSVAFHAWWTQRAKDLSPKMAASKHTFLDLQPELDNRCFQTKTAAEQWMFLQELDALPESDFKKTIADLNSINAADRLLGTRGCNEQH
jgi:hypothetical protein